MARNPVGSCTLQYVQSIRYEGTFRGSRMMMSGQRAFIKLGSDGVHNHCCNASHIFIPPTRCLCFQHLEPLQMATSTDTVSGAPPNPPHPKRRPGRQPVSCAECRRSGSHLPPVSCLPTVFNSTFIHVRLKLRCDRKVIGIASRKPPPHFQSLTSSAPGTLRDLSETRMCRVVSHW